MTYQSSNGPKGAQPKHSSSASCWGIVNIPIKSGGLKGSIATDGDPQVYNESISPRVGGINV